MDEILERLKGLHPKVIDLALDRIEGLLAALGHPERRLPPVVHIAGTNGKGSTLAYLRAIAEAAGARVQVYTSPHLVHFAERIRINGALIDSLELTAILGECERMNEGRPITFFEITTAAALLAFSRHQSDLCLLETGLGGRVDATNVIEKPALTLLAPISLDHQAYLGGTIAAIAAEKSGILKPGVPSITSRQEPEALAVIERRAAELGVPLLVEGRDWDVEESPDGMLFTLAAFGAGTALELPRPGLLGAHQIHNAGLAIAAALFLGDQAGGHAITGAAIAQGLRSVEWPARLQRLDGRLAARLPAGWELWLDGGHNPAAGQILARLAVESWRDRPLDLIVGMLNSKDITGFLKPLAPLVRSLRAIAIPGEANALSAEQCAEMAVSEGILAKPAAGLDEAIDELAGGPCPGRILITGSLYLAGAVLARNK